MQIQRGEIWWADLGVPEGSEPGYRRPVLVVQADFMTDTALRTVIVVGISSNLALAGFEGNLLLPRTVTQLPQDSVVNISQFITINKKRLEQKVCQLPDSLMRYVEYSMLHALGFEA